MSLHRSALPALLLGCILLLCLGLSPAHQKVALAQPYAETLPASLETSPLNAATDSQNIELVSHVGGIANDVALRGSYAYAGVGPELAVIDISDPAHPERIGYLVLSDTVTDIHLSGQYAYVALVHDGLVIVDISEPTAPVQVGTFPEAHAAEVVVTGQHAYIAASGSGLWVLDISNPAAPSGFKLSDAETRNVAVAGHHLYTDGSPASTDASIRVLDISNPTAPTEISSYYLSGESYNFVYDIVVRDNYAYLATFKGFEVLDVSDPSHLEPQGDLGFFSDGPEEVTLMGDYAYLRSSGSIRVVNIANPADPAEVSAYSLPDGTTSIAIDEHHIVVADNVYGLRLFDISNPEVLTPIGAGWPVLPLGSSTVWVDGYLYAASGEDWKILDVSDPITPTVVGTFTANAVEWVVAGDYAYGFNFYELIILDVSDPTAPTQIASFTQPGATFADIALYGDYAYFADYGECTRGGCFNGGVWVIDISNPAAPAEAGFVEGSTSTVTVVKDYLYRRSESGSLEALDLADPAHPTSAGPLPSLSSFVVEGDFLYSVQSGRLDIYDVSNPLSPARRSSYPTFTYSPLTALNLVNNRLYIAGGTSPESDTSSVLTVVDVSNPDVPIGLGRYVGRFGTGLEASGDYIYSVGQGLFVLHYTGGTLTTYNSYLPLASRNR